MNYTEAIQWLFSTQLFGIKLGLDNTKLLLKKFLAYPALGTQVIHVAGTNGKGSTCAIMDSVLRSLGKKCGLFTSPHLIEFRERIQVMGIEIPEEACAERLTKLRHICEQMTTHPTFFEITLVLAMRWFRDCECEIIILETGMGGRLDATTAVPADICVLTTIGLDHMQWLGDTIEQITTEKCGILVEGKPLISAPQTLEAEAIIEQEANEKRSPLTFVREPLIGYTIALDGEHQYMNAAVAMATLHRLGLQLSYDSVHDGLRKVRWPGRFEQFRHDDVSIILDGAHNPQAAEILAQTWNRYFPKRPCILIFSAVTSKDISNTLMHLLPLADELLFCTIKSERGVDLDTLSSLVPSSHPYQCFEHLHDALNDAIQRSKNNGAPILIAGSLYLVGEARALLLKQPFQSSLQ